MDVCPYCGVQLRKKFDEEKLKLFRRIANIVGFAICAVLLVFILANRCSA
jgi:hypothetical protein